MSIKHHLTPSPSRYPRRYAITKIPFAATVFLFIIILSVVLPNKTYAVEAGALGVGVDSSEETVSTPLPDSFGRDTPRHAVQGFISALGENDYLLASNYLNLSKSDNPTTIVRQFKQALDAGGRFQQDFQVSNAPEGNLTDQLPPSQENVGVINIGDRSVPLLLERVVSKQNEQYWQFSRDTLSSIPEVIENTEPTLVSRYTVASLEGKKLFGYQLADLVAALAMIVTSFVLTYVAVWLLYHLLKIAYPYVRGTPLPLPNKVILPLSVVTMALILSEVMVYAGVSVTLREPVNRFTDIASWVATTWLLLRVIDTIFTHAVNLSYRKNYTERVSILGLLRKVVKALLLIIAVIVIFGNLGFDLTTGIAALGVGGLALALGAQKTIENLVGSVVVVADSPVRIGDYCKFGTYEGTVIDIGIRSSRVRTLTRTIVTVPNGDFSSMQIENFTSRDMFRFFHHLYLKRTADLDVIFKMVNDLDEFIKKHDLTNQEWNQVNILELRQDCYVIQLQAYVNATGIIEFYDKQNTLFVDVLKKVAKYKVEHALPTQQLIVNQTELEDHIDNNTAELIEKEESNDSSATSNDDANVSLDRHDDNNSDGNNIPKEDDNPKKGVDIHKSSMPTMSRQGALKALKHKSRMLRKSKFKHTKRKFSFSIWNQP
ncbi:MULTISPECIES: mechanosensitive ion channel domain-containing protein [unclassified Psychrobacter]|uniref:mechanosensitive ion channel domain-containing protein n=1 Tax=unclassified Psychrobacter TaxID=196806 RepID=UPI0025B4E5D3|nr:MULTISPECIES: mechanosensitive ion channel domain-containing protein [unclassified Psychrobacter]MDN3454328.1 mechanosensitive ion channel [Psychrobacter sp. APC 3350]MDN3503560.1 mechanosensitive ion channel [Psychrobacter sp. 5A.1]